MPHPFHVPTDEPALYRITVLGQLDAQFAARLGDLQLGAGQNAEGAIISTLSGRLQDQAALLGILVQLYNRGHCLLALERAFSSPGWDKHHLLDEAQIRDSETAGGQL